jgi:outer membrane protein OmpA-like peptidoglycan-associated protein
MIYSNESQEKLPDAVVILRNLTDGRVDSVTTARGSYSFEIQPNKKYLIGAKREGFIGTEFELNTKGIITGSLVNDIVLEEKFEEKVVLRFDLEKWDIKKESEALLNSVVKAMKKNARYRLHVGAHADSQGTHEFNLDLSHKRANAVVTYLEAHGVAANRVTAVGFGEELLLNRCSNGVVCHDDDHAKNRRAELKVQ